MQRAIKRHTPQPEDSQAPEKFLLDQMRLPALDEKLFDHDTTYGCRSILASDQGFTSPKMFFPEKKRFRVSSGIGIGSR
jgi:hypothetical protein